MLSAVAVLVGVGVPGAGALGAGGADAASGAAAVVTGTVERLHLDDFSHAAAAGTGADSDELAFVRTGVGAVQVPASDVDGIAEGSTVKVALASTEGVRITAGGAVSTTPPVAEARDPEAGADVASVQVLAAPEASTTAGTAGPTAAGVAAAANVHQVTVVVVTPAGGSASTVSAQTVANVVSSAVNSYWSTVTNGQVGFTATAYPSVVTTASTPCVNGSVSTSYTFWDEIATKIGWVGGPGKHLVAYFKALADCGGTAGLGTVGSGITDGGFVWTNGYATTGVLGHELGHNLGLGHSQELDCAVNGARVMDAAPAYCTKHSYWDTNDIMAVSWQNQGYLNASHLRRLGVLEPGAETSPTNLTGQVALTPLETGSGQRVLTLSVGATRYVVEYRAGIGLDSWMASSPGWGQPGVTVRREFDQGSLPPSAYFPSHESFVLDGDPASPDANFGQIKTVVPMGRWLNLAAGRLSIRVDAQSSAGAIVSYANGYVPGTTTLVAVAPGAPPPSLSAPTPVLAKGAVRAARSGLVVPVVWRWTIAVPSANPAAATALQSAAATTSVSAALKGFRAYAYRARAMTSLGPIVSPKSTVLAHYTVETPSRSLKYSKGWKAVKVKGAVGSALRLTAGRNVYLGAAVKARAAGVLLQYGPRNGAVAIYVDGHRAAVISTRANRTSTRLAWTTTFAGPLRVHGIRVVNLSKGSRGQLGFDGLVTLV